MHCARRYSEARKSRLPPFWVNLISVYYTSLFNYQNRTLYLRALGRTYLYVVDSNSPKDCLCGTRLMRARPWGPSTRLAARTWRASAPSEAWGQESLASGISGVWGLSWKININVSGIYTHRNLAIYKRYGPSCPKDWLYNSVNYALNQYFFTHYKT